VLEKMCGPLCDAVLARSGSAGMLEQLDGSNLFVVPLDRQRRWYRYHRLFRDLLLAELERREPDVVPELNRRAAVWCEEHGVTEDAIDYACVAGDVERVARLVGTAAIRVYHGGAMPRVRRWIDWLAEHDSLERQPSAAAAGAWVRTFDGDLVGAEQLLDIAERASAEMGGSSGTGSIEPSLAAVRSAMCRHGVERMGEDAGRAVAEIPLRSGWRPQALLLRGVSRVLAGDTESAEPALLEAAEAAESIGLGGIGAVALAEASLLAGGRGDWEAAESLAAEAHELLAGMGEHPSGAIVHAAAARAALRRGDVEAARNDLASAERLRPGLTRALPWLAVQTRLELARCCLSLADPDRTRALLAEADRLLGWRPSLGLLRDIADDLRIQLDACRAGRGSWAATLTAAELRLLPLLTTHLSFREIAERLFVSRNTVKTQAISIYRKLGASSRSEAIERAGQLGLVDAGAIQGRSTSFPSL
jgi:LuxR family maltose regulon positive regulatory protein